MKAEELMIGDWVEYGSYIATVWNLSDKIVLSGCVGRLDEVNPVKITPEILEKNGFTRYGQVYANLQQWVGKFGDKRKSFVQNIRTGEWGMNDVWINYVHELQHVLKLCKIENVIFDYYGGGLVQLKKPLG